MDIDIASVALQFVQSYVLPAAGVGLAGLLAVWMGQWQARAKVAAMHKNADLAVKAAEQMKKTTGMSNEDAAKYALSLATSWNKLAGINSTDAVVLSMNEGSILNLPNATPAPVVSSVSQSVPTVSVPTVTIDEVIPKG